MRQYLDLLKHVRENGVFKSDRTGVGTYSSFGHQMRFDISGYLLPLVTTKLTHLRSIIHENLWFLEGTPETDYLNQNDVTIWDEWTRNKVYANMSVGERLDRVKGKNKAAIVEAFDQFRDEQYSNTEVPGWEYLPLQQRYRIPDIGSVLHQWLDENTKVSRKKLIKGELGPVYGVQWRQWPIAKETRAITHRSAARYIESVTDIEDLKARFTEALDLDIWLLGAKTSKPLLDTGNDAIIGGWLLERGFPITEEVTVKSIDQIAKVIEQLRTNPDSRRMLVSAWNPADLDAMALEPCHSLFQFYSRELTQNELIDVIFRSSKQRSIDMWLFGTVEPDIDRSVYAAVAFDDLMNCVKTHDLPTRGLSCQLYQRSSDLFLGVPFNIASYAILTKMIAQVVGMAPLEFIWTGGDVHIYANHLEQVDLQLTREPKELPRLLLNSDIKDIDSFKFEDFTLMNYEHHPAISAPVAI